MRAQEKREAQKYDNADGCWHGRKSRNWCRRALRDGEDKMKEPFLTTEAQLLGWGDGRNSGPWIKLRLADPETLDKFRGLDTATAKNTGHLFDLALIETDHAPLPERIPEKWDEMKPSKQAALLCTKPGFQTFVNVDSPRDAAIYIRERCGVGSRAELNEGKNSCWEKLKADYYAWQGTRDAQERYGDYPETK